MDLRLATVAAFSSVPGLVHGFEQRPEKGTVETRDETRSRVGRALADAGGLLLLTQVHGTTVAQAPWEGRPEADAATATAPGTLVGIQTADCLPLLLVDPRRRVVAAAHAGWRGTAAGIAGRTVEALASGGSRPRDLLVATGPSIGPCCYEVGEELREAFGPEGAPFFRPGPRGRPHLDVRAANVRQLERAGIRPDRIHHLSDCTACREGLYYSYRRDGPGTGRMISFIGFRTLQGKR